MFIFKWWVLLVTITVIIDLFWIFVILIIMVFILKSFPALCDFDKLSPLSHFSSLLF